MKGIPRRHILKGALFVPFLWPLEVAGSAVPELDSIEGRKIQRIADVNNMTAIEREHFIKIDAPDTVRAGGEFSVTVSLPNHPTGKVHHISWLRFYLDNDLVTYVTFAPTWQRPEVSFTFMFPKGQRLDVVASCTLHGLWGMSRPIAIAPSDSIGVTGVSRSSVPVPPSSSSHRGSSLG